MQKQPNETNLKNIIKRDIFFLLGLAVIFAIMNIATKKWFWTIGSITLIGLALIRKYWLGKRLRR